MSVRGKEFPSFVQEAGDGYKLRLPVPGPDGRERNVFIPPPQDIVTDETDLWPSWCFQLLLVASEYVAALHEFMTWSFPVEWSSRKAQVAGYARQLIRNSSSVPQPPLWQQQQQQQQQQPRDDEDCSAYCVWAAFTHCYFHGLRKPADGNRAAMPPTSGEQGEASWWLHRLVGDRGWQKEGPVFSAAARWVGATLLRLQPLFPDVAALSAAEWASRLEQQRGVAAALRSVATRGDKNAQGRYVPVYPYHMTGTWSENRFKLTLKGHVAPRSVKGSCGVPQNFGQTSNCALGYLVLADVTEAFTTAFEEAARFSWLVGQEALQKHVILDFYASVLSSDTVGFKGDYVPYGYPSYLVACALGWKLVLEQLPRWLTAAAASAAAAGLMVGEGAQMELLMPMQRHQQLQRWQLHLSPQLPQLPPPPQHQHVQPLQMHTDLQPQQQPQQYTLSCWAPPAVVPDGVGVAATPRGPPLARNSVTCEGPGAHTTPTSPAAAVAVAVAQSSVSPYTSPSCAHRGAPTAVSPFVALQQQQQQQQQRQRQQSPAVLQYLSPTIPSPLLGSLEAAQNLLQQRQQQPPLLSPMPHLVGGAAAAATSVATGVPAAEKEVTSGLSNMSLDGPMAPFGDETLRLIGEDLARMEPAGPPQPLIDAAPAMTRTGLGAEAAAVGAPGNAQTGCGIRERVCLPGLLDGNAQLPHLPETPSGNVLVPARTITTVLQVPQRCVPPTPPPPPLTPPNQPIVAAAAVRRVGSAADTPVAAPKGGDCDGDTGAGAGADEAGVVLQLQVSVETLREVLDSYPQGAVRPARLVRLHREMAAALEAYDHQHRRDHPPPPPPQQQQQQQQQQAPTPVMIPAATAATAATGCAGRFHSPFGNSPCINTVKPTPTLLPGLIPGPFGSSVFVPSPMLFTPGPFGGGGGLAIHCLTPGPFVAASAATTTATTTTTTATTATTTTTTRAREQTPPPQQQNQNQKQVGSDVPGPGRGEPGPAHGLDSGPNHGVDVGPDVTASPPAAVGCTLLQSGKDFLVIDIKREVLGGTAAEGTMGPMCQTVLDPRGAEDLLRDSGGGGGGGGGRTAGSGSGYGDVGVGCGSQTGSLGLLSLLGAVEGDSSILELEFGLGLGLGLGPAAGGGSAAGGCGGCGCGGGDASGMSWSRESGTSPD